LSWREWSGFTKPRDAPDTELPQIEDNVRDSGGVFVFGMTNSGELVNEKSALQIPQYILNLVKSRPAS
jgi:hypothetical protein